MKNVETIIVLDPSNLYELDKGNDVEVSGNTKVRCYGAPNIITLLKDQLRRRNLQIKDLKKIIDNYVSKIHEEKSIQVRLRKEIKEKNIKIHDLKIDLKAETDCHAWHHTDE